VYEGRNLPPVQLVRMDYNVIKSVRDTTSSITEPITTQEVKDWVRLEGFTAVGGSELTFSDDDTIITMIRTAVREQFEKITNLTLTATRTKEVVLTNLCGDIELPYGPIGSVTAALDCEGNTIDTDDIELTGTHFKYLKSPKYADMTITYTCGYGTSGCETLPQSIKMDMLRAAAYYYMNRGDDPAVQKFIYQLALKYSRNTWLV